SSPAASSVVRSSAGCERVMVSRGGVATEAAEQKVDRAALTRSGLGTRYAPRVGLIALLVVAVALPFTLSNFRTFQFTQVLIYAIALLGLNMLTGYNGQISIGHSAFYAIGAYTSAIMIDRWSIGYGFTIPVAGLLCLVVGFLFG